MYLEAIFYPIEPMRNILIGFADNAHFDVANDGFILFFKWICFPILWTLTEFQIYDNLLMAPWLILYTLIDENIFID